MPRRRPATVRSAETICSSHDKAAHYIPGVGPGVIAAIIVLEHGRLCPGQIAGAFRRWEILAKSSSVYRAASNPCGYEECCGRGPRGLLEDVLHLLPERARPGYRRAVGRIDQIYLRRTRPDPCVSPDAPWWERRY